MANGVGEEAMPDDEMRETGPSLRVAEKIGFTIVLGLDGGPATASGFRLVRPEFRAQRDSPQECYQALGKMP